MFKKRQSRKPTEDFYMNFRKNYSDITQTTNEAPATPAQTLGSTSNEDLGMSFNTQWGQVEDGKDQLFDTTGEWQHLFNDTGANGLDVWCQPTPAIDGTLNFTPHEDLLNLPMAGPMHMETGLTTPLSRSMTDTTLHQVTQTPTLNMNDFMNTQYHQPAYYNPHQIFSHVQLPGNSSLQYPGPPVYKNMHGHGMGVKYEAPPVEQGVYRPEMSKFRFQASLLTATAMLREDEDVPVTYLNKCQTYKVSIRDTAPSHMPGVVTKYRTFIRISFEDEQQRERPGHCWQLWKEGRGMSESHQRGGRLQAVEYVPTTQGQSAHRGSNVEVVSESFDGFCVTWTPTYHGQAECEVQVKFNFLSTDFSHSKGVKGIPVRLCAKTELLNSSSSMASAEISYCKVKLFRDHGAERKLANDDNSVKKSIDKVKAQIAQSQSSAVINESGKRRRSDTNNNPRPSKIAKNKRASSVSSSSSIGLPTNTVEDDLHGKLALLEALQRSRKDESLFTFEGEEKDDPDTHQVTLQGQSGNFPGISSPDVQKLERHSTLQSQPSMDSPTPSSADFGSPSQRTSGLSILQTPASTMQPSKAPKLEISTARAPMMSATESNNPQSLISPPEETVQIQKADNDWIEALGVDQNYEPPKVTATKPVACFYIKPKGTELFRAIYLRRRTLEEFLGAVSRKHNIDAKSITSTIRVNERGLHIEVDNETIAEMREGQDMITEVSFVDSSTHRKLILRY